MATIVLLFASFFSPLWGPLPRINAVPRPAHVFGMDPQVKIDTCVCNPVEPLWECPCQLKTY